MYVPDVVVNLLEVNLVIKMFMTCRMICMPVSNRFDLASVLVDKKVKTMVGLTSGKNLVGYFFENFD